MVPVGPEPTNVVFCFLSRLITWTRFCRGNLLLEITSIDTMQCTVLISFNNMNEQKRKLRVTDGWVSGSVIVWGFEVNWNVMKWKMVKNDIGETPRERRRGPAATTTDFPQKLWRSRCYTLTLTCWLRIETRMACADASGRTGLLNHSKSNVIMIFCRISLLNFVVIEYLTNIGGYN